MEAFLSSWVPIPIMSLMGIALLILEVFMPGFGLPGISGIVLEIATLVFVYLNYGVIPALIALILLLSLTALALSIALRSAARGRLSRSEMILSASENKEQGYTATEDMSVFIGREGTALTALRPSGIGDFDGVRMDIVSEGDFIPSGVRVRIIQTDGSSIVVRPCTKEA